MSSSLVVFILSVLLGIQPITTDLYLPALPALADGFGATMSQAQLTLTGLLLAFGISQLFWGPLSDRFGRKPILLIGLGAYTLASVGSTFVHSIEALIAWRIVQGAAMGAGVMCARAVVRDLYAPEQAARVMSRGLTGLGVIACLSAPLGGLMSDAFGWRIALSALAVFGAISCAVIALRFQETLSAPNPRATELHTLLANWWAIVRTPSFVAYALLAATTYGGLFTFLAGSSFVMIKVLGLSKTQYGLTMFSISMVYILGTFICRRLLTRFGVQRSVAIGGVFTLSAGVSMAALAWAGVHTVWAIMLPFYLFMLGHGIHQPCGQSGAVSAFPHAAGAASALSGFGMMVMAFVMGLWLGTHLDGTVYALTNGIAFWSMLITLTAWILVQRYGHIAKT
jgi:MFS transporter, DHA1 family, multidrug resistance protein